MDLPNYTPYNGILFDSWYIRDRKAYEFADHPAFGTNIPSDSCTTIEIARLGAGLDGVAEPWRFRFSCDDPVITDGAIRIETPALDVTANSCYMGVGSQVGDPADLFWRYTYPTFIQAENFSY